jgi:hypothetical protein
VIGMTSILFVLSSTLWTPLLLCCARNMQVAMLDWSQPLVGEQTAAEQPPYVSQWTSSNPMFTWSRLERGVLRVSCAEIAAEPFLQRP